MNKGICLNCKKEFERRCSLDKRCKRTFCSLDCNYKYKKGKKWEEFFGKEISDIRREKLKLSSIGINNPYYGQKHSIEIRKKMSKPKINIGNMGKYFRTKEQLKKTSETFKRMYKSGKLKSVFIKGNKYWDNDKTKLTRFKNGHKHSEEIKMKMLKSIASSKLIHPNKPETILLNFIKENNLNFSFVGDGKFWISNGSNAFNPDFISKDMKHIIEVFGNYWHNIPKVKLRDKERLETYKKYGYNTLVIWEHELKDIPQITNKMNTFLIQ